MGERVQVVGKQHTGAIRVPGEEMPMTRAEKAIGLERPISAARNDGRRRG